MHLAGDNQIYVMPSGWREEPWWSDDQTASLRAILEDIKRDYNVDENRVFLSGVSDGATGIYYIATHDTTPWAAFLPLNGYMLVLRSPELELRASIFLNNLRDKPFFLVNGGRDPLYPIALVEPTIAHLDHGGVRITYVPQPDAGHDTNWWPTVKETFESFVRTHPRVPLPDTLTWEVSDTRTWNRAHWLVVDSLGTTPADAKGLPDLNLVAGTPIFHNGKSGRVDLVRRGNTVTLQSRGVKELTLLLSPDQFDFDRNVVVIANGRTVFDARVEQSVATLTKWAARDNDRTMLFGAEIKIKVAGA
jgi:predicted esterase